MIASRNERYLTVDYLFMPKRYLVKDYMHTPVYSIPTTATMKEAVEAMIEHRTNGLLVVDSKGHLAGILSGWDVISFIVPEYIEKDLHLASFEDQDLFETRIHELKNANVTEFMTSNVHTTQPSHSLMEAASLLSEFRIRQLPVVDDHGNLCGYINRTDIKRAIGDILGIHPQ